MLTEHEPLTSVQVPPGVKVTVPVGVVEPAPEVSATVAEHDRDTPMVPVAGQVTVVEVVLRVTPRPNVPKLPACVASALYVPVIV